MSRLGHASNLGLRQKRGSIDCVIDESDTAIGTKPKSADHEHSHGGLAYQTSSATSFINAHIGDIVTQRRQSHSSIKVTMPIKNRILR
jgi:hypothetical protein